MCQTKPISNPKSVIYMIKINNSLINNRVKCLFSPCCLGHFASLVQRFYFSPVDPKRFHHCHFSPLG
ncbi:hypothetical protein Hanom_Chr17g01578161 [Helianthus anomalus]